MPARHHMTWEPGPRRWRKVYRGHTYTVSCRQLGAPETKDGSYQQANAWWTTKRAEIDGNQPPHPHADEIAELTRRRDWAQRHDEGDLAGFYSRQAKVLRANPEAPSNLELNRKLRVQMLQAKYGLDLGGTPPDLLEYLLSDDRIWADRLQRDHAEPVPDDQTVGGLVERFLQLEIGRVEANDLTPSEYDTVRRCLNAFRDWLGGELPIERMNADKWEDWWRHLLKWDGSVEYRKKRFRLARSFVEWVASKGLITLPPNLHSRKYRFGGSFKEVPTMTVEEVRRLVENAPGQLRLHLLLMANTGMLQTDISELRQDEVDWTEGRVIRKRSKTGDNANVPTVNYKLWPETWDLLQTYRRDEDDRVLLTESGKPWVRDGLDAKGKRSKVDAIMSNYAHLKRKLGFAKPLKLLRKTSASLLDKDKDFGRYAGHFLGHAPRTVRDKHYIKPDQDNFDAAIAWLGRQYGFLP